MRARIDISEVEAHTMIRAKYLRALENEEWGLVPGPVYVKSFLKTYGDYLGLDSRLLIDEFKRRYERPNDNEPRPASATVRERERARAPGRVRRTLLSPVGVIVVALCVIVAALYVIGSSGGPSTSPQAGGVTPASGPGHAKHHGKQHGGGHGGGSGSGSGTHARTTGSGGSTGSKTRTGTTGTGTGSGVAPTKATLAMVSTGRVWVCVENETGKALFQGTYTQGQAIPPASGKQLLVTLGNNEVTMTVNGQPYTLTSSTAAIGLKITPHGVSTLPPPLPTCA